LDIGKLFLFLPSEIRFGANDGGAGAASSLAVRIYIEQIAAMRARGDSINSLGSLAADLDLKFVKHGIDHEDTDYLRWSR